MCPRPAAGACREPRRHCADGEEPGGVQAARSQDPGHWTGTAQLHRGVQHGRMVVQGCAIRTAQSVTNAAAGHLCWVFASACIAHLTVCMCKISIEWKPVQACHMSPLLSRVVCCQGHLTEIAAPRLAEQAGHDCEQRAGPPSATGASWPCSWGDGRPGVCQPRRAGNRRYPFGNSTGDPLLVRFLLPPPSSFLRASTCSLRCWRPSFPLNYCLGSRLTGLPLSHDPPWEAQEGPAGLCCLQLWRVCRQRGHRR